MTISRKAAIVGNEIPPSTPSRKPDGTVVHTLWGELAWQLGGADGYGGGRADLHECRGWLAGQRQARRKRSSGARARHIIGSAGMM